MRSTEILMNEHRVIEQVLTCLERMSTQALAAGKLDETAARDALDFFQNFADGCHHRKEEDHLFPMMEARGFPRHGGPTGVMLSEHEEGRRHIRALRAALPGAAAGRRDDLEQFAGHARAYVELLRAHIFKEDHRLFVMADQVFTPLEEAELVDRFAHVEDEEGRRGKHERYLQIADRLAERFGVARAAHSSCGCGHAPSAKPQVELVDLGIGD